MNHIIKFKGLEIGSRHGQIVKVDSIGYGHAWPPDLKDYRGKKDSSDPNTNHINSILVFNVNDSQPINIIIKKFDPKSNKNIFHVYEVKYELDFENWISEKHYLLDPYQGRQKDDILNLHSMVNSFPGDYVHNAQPIVSLNFNIKNMSKKAFVYYNETNDLETETVKYRIHVLSYENGVNGWVWDQEYTNGKPVCFDLGEEDKVESAVALPQLTRVDDSHMSFNYLEFYRDGRMSIKQFYINLEKSTLETYWKNLAVTSKFSEFYCDLYQFSVINKTITDPTIETTNETQMTSSTEMSESDTNSKTEEMTSLISESETSISQEITDYTFSETTKVDVHSISASTISITATSGRTVTGNSWSWIILLAILATIILIVVLIYFFMGQYTGHYDVEQAEDQEFGNEEEIDATEAKTVPQTTHPTETTTSPKPELTSDSEETIFVYQTSQSKPETAEPTTETTRLTTIPSAPPATPESALTSISKTNDSSVTSEISDESTNNTKIIDSESESIKSEAD